MRYLITWAALVVWGVLLIIVGRARDTSAPSFLPQHPAMVAVYGHSLPAATGHAQPLLSPDSINVLLFIDLECKDTRIRARDLGQLANLEIAAGRRVRFVISFENDADADTRLPQLIEGLSIPGAQFLLDLGRETTRDFGVRFSPTLLTVSGDGRIVAAAVPGEGWPRPAPKPIE